MKQEMHVMVGGKTCPENLSLWLNYGTKVKIQVKVNFSGLKSLRAVVRMRKGIPFQMNTKVFIPIV